MSDLQRVPLSTLTQEAFEQHHPFSSTWLALLLPPSKRSMRSSPLPARWAPAFPRLKVLVLLQSLSMHLYIKDNHEKYHIFFNYEGFHNHSTHHLFSIYTLGASPTLLEAAHATHIVYQRAAADSPAQITTKNWKDHFGDERCYISYAAFFANAVLEKGAAATIELYCFSPEANWEDN